MRLVSIENTRESLSHLPSRYLINVGRIKSKVVEIFCGTRLVIEKKKNFSLYVIFEVLWLVLTRVLPRCGGDKRVLPIDATVHLLEKVLGC